MSATFGAPAVSSAAVKSRPIFGFNPITERKPELALRP